MSVDPWEEHTVRPVMPESITPETFGNDDVAEVVYIPTTDVWDGDTANTPQVEMRAMDNETPALPVYTSYERLAERAGECQPFIEYRSAHLDVLAHVLGAHGILWDVWIHPSVRHTVVFHDEEGNDNGD